MHTSVFSRIRLQSLISVSSKYCLTLSHHSSLFLDVLCSSCTAMWLPYIFHWNVLVHFIHMSSISLDAFPSCSPVLSLSLLFLFLLPIYSILIHSLILTTFTPHKNFISRDRTLLVNRVDGTYHLLPNVTLVCFTISFLLINLPF